MKLETYNKIIDYCYSIDVYDCNPSCPIRIVCQELAKEFDLNQNIAGEYIEDQPYSDLFEISVSDYILSKESSDILIDLEIISKEDLEND